jgi:hypothetical protein
MMAAMAEKHTHYRDYRDVRGDGRIVLYRRADTESPNWTARLKIPDTVGYVVKSTKTSDDFEARRFAEDLYFQLEGRARRGESVNAPLFKRVFEEWMASLSMDRKVRSARYIDGNVRRIEIWALPRLGNQLIDRLIRIPFPTMYSCGSTSQRSLLQLQHCATSELFSIRYSILPNARDISTIIPKLAYQREGKTLDQIFPIKNGGRSTHSYAATCRKHKTSAGTENASTSSITS